MDIYTIKKAMHFSDLDEIEIKSENLIYAEIGLNHSGCQSNSLKNNDKIQNKCAQIANLIRDIEKLNK